MMEPALPQRQRSSALCPEWPEAAKNGGGFLLVGCPARFVGTEGGSGMRWPYAHAHVVICAYACSMCAGACVLRMWITCRSYELGDIVREVRVGRFTCRLSLQLSILQNGLGVVHAWVGQIVTFFAYRPPSRPLGSLTPTQPGRVTNPTQGCPG